MSGSTRDLRVGGGGAGGGGQRDRAERPTVSASGASDSRSDEGDELIGQMIGGYEITRVIGRGGMGVIYLGQHPTLGKRVAVKVIPSEQADNEDLRRRFVDEAQRVASVTSPHVVEVRDLAMLPDGRFYMAMELLEGESLSQRLARGPLPPAEATELALQALAGLAAIHERGLVHRDVKPSNLFLATTPSGKPHVKVLDFGLAKLRDPGSGGRVTLKGTVLGTPGYMSPEQARGEDVDARADVYAIGVVLHEMLTGRPLFETDDIVELQYKHATAERPPLPNVPPPLTAVVMRALALDLRERYADANDMRRALSAVVDSQTTPKTTSAAPPSRTPRRRPVLWLLAVPVALGAGVALWVATRSTDSAQPVIAHTGDAADDPRGTNLVAADAQTMVATSLDAAIDTRAPLDASAAPSDAASNAPTVVRASRRDAGVPTFSEQRTATIDASVGPVAQRTATIDAGGGPVAQRPGAEAAIDPLGPAPPAPDPGEAVSMLHPRLVWGRLHDFVKGRPYAGHLGSVVSGTPITLHGPAPEQFYRVRIAAHTKVFVEYDREVTWGILDPEGWSRCESTSVTTAACVMKISGDHFLRVTPRTKTSAFTITLTHNGLE